MLLKPKPSKMVLPLMIPSKQSNKSLRKSLTLKRKLTSKLWKKPKQNMFNKKCRSDRSQTKVSRVGKLHLARRRWTNRIQARNVTRRNRIIITFCHSTSLPRRQKVPVAVIIAVIIAATTDAIIAVTTDATTQLIKPTFLAWELKSSHRTLTL